MMFSFICMNVRIDLALISGIPRLISLTYFYNKAFLGIDKNLNSGKLVHQFNKENFTDRERMISSKFLILDDVKIRIQDVRYKICLQ